MVSEVNAVIALALIASVVFSLIVFKSAALLVASSPAAITIVYHRSSFKCLQVLTVSSVSIEAVIVPEVVVSKSFAVSTLIVPLSTFIFWS